ncbi:probable peptide chain release factor C12orf65, mitochondrial isoform X2 [Cephus cinctus]|uniref:Probable peptide chain release factor C12orf65, mitochondrial isoform X2 n=1 Tax=Cephus cinctus TaxID=211228 RepID=A0AAJ7BTE1_CEPCN|nr:probable peptide chain release factor C12orf65, mitochondrial isoform X2 [Cephus cinctus]
MKKESFARVLLGLLDMRKQLIPVAKINNANKLIRAIHTNVLNKYTCLGFPQYRSCGIPVTCSMDVNSKSLILCIVKQNLQCPIYVRGKTSRHLDYSRVPKLLEEDLEEQHVRGSGPGGQATNKTSNCVVLRHRPTGIVVKCHETRSLWDNQRRAREILLRKFDNLINGEYSLESQERNVQSKHLDEKQRRKKKLAELKKAFKKREVILL